jgi:hypothetical protein
MRCLSTLAIVSLGSLFASACAVGDDAPQDDPAETDAIQASPSPDAVIAKQCGAIHSVSQGQIGGCVQEDDLHRFNAVADVNFGVAGHVSIDLQQCRGDGTGCGFVAHSEATLSGHKFLPTPIIAGAHGHSYRAVYRVDEVDFVATFTSPFIAFP